VVAVPMSYASRASSASLVLVATFSRHTFVPVTSNDLLWVRYVDNPIVELTAYLAIAHKGCTPRTIRLLFSRWVRRLVRVRLVGINLRRLLLHGRLICETECFILASLAKVEFIAELLGVALRKLFQVSRLMVLETERRTGQSLLTAISQDSQGLPSDLSS
jgi:hypothetical protein